MGGKHSKGAGPLEDHFLDVQGPLSWLLWVLLLTAVLELVYIVASCEMLYSKGTLEAGRAFADDIFRACRST